MIPIVDITVPANSFELGQLLEELPSIHIELEQLIPLRDEIIPLFWVSDGNQDEIIYTLEQSSLTEEVRYLTTDGKRDLYEVHWSSEVDGIIQLLIETQARMLEGESIGEGWDFRLQFPSHEALSDFRERCEERGIPVMLRRLYNPHYPEKGTPMSSEQHEAIITAYEHGYFDVPRSTSLAKLSSEFGISDSAYSQRLRRGLNSLIFDTMVD
ncbi:MULTISPECIES: helix-turn-helix domain-containing protein [unclassified Haladaptatus]|uniref:helix-turn-helix domain-containing protein n=1 Tax=unclassified Haladaptatus TaxID=2622732 RepID=UPI00209C23FC|nr:MULTISPECIES: helix-turn-helix domain-containing protein [unclassified Haladaptatus]MCO8244941.1 helix-turn-helix domain-containing protein [Haladaptatus sp. AB643]MCO8255546.1 helix-turn-helix domain-containing protein [Haladaptatus sp. AB618]